MPEVNGINLPFIPVGGTKDLQKEKVNVKQSFTGESFNEVFEKELNKIKFSAHAQSRMESRDIEINRNDYLRLENAFSLAKNKGSNESLILMDEKAFVVSVQNNTVITIVDKENLKDTVFTNIDSAVIVK